eukprot:c9748_g1_i1.p1 GENE.c9748_g1_i1~~c9748_g1_i1.p1  ORF type:complete len:264 (+),score=43.77 c9748_g1_i1:351-1142(+)
MGNNIHKSAQNGDLKAVRRCLDKQIDVNKRGAEETTPLHKAAEHGHVAVCELLLSRGADVKAKDEDGNMPLHCAATKGHSPVCELLVSRGAEVKAKNTDGRTPLHSAAYNGHLKVCEMLLLRGADVKARDKYGDTPLDDAKAQQMLEVSVLLERWTLKAAAIAVVPSESFGPKSMQAPPLEETITCESFLSQSNSQHTAYKSLSKKLKDERSAKITKSMNRLLWLCLSQNDSWKRWRMECRITVCLNSITQARRKASTKCYLC